MNTPIANYFFEAGNLSRTRRSFYDLLGTGSQSVAEHINRMGYIAYALGKLDGTVNIGKIFEMTLFHDFAEARTSDLNYVQQKYVNVDEDAALQDMTRDLPFGKDIRSTIEAYETRESREAILVKEADILELLVSLKEAVDTGHASAATWFPPVLERLKTDLGKEVAESILETDFDTWWFGNKKDDWWVNRKKT